jgi:enoyl-CoA hydratase/carnithine racemase
LPNAECGWEQEKEECKVNQGVNLEVKEEIGIITLHRPEKRNAINEEVLEGIQRAFSQLSLNPEVKVILLQGAGAAFSAGIDFTHLAGVARMTGGLRAFAFAKALKTSRGS